MNLYEYLTWIGYSSLYLCHIIWTLHLMYLWCAYQNKWSWNLGFWKGVSLFASVPYKGFLRYNVYVNCNRLGTCWPVYCGDLEVSDPSHLFTVLQCTLLSLVKIRLYKTDKGCISCHPQARDLRYLVLRWGTCPHYLPKKADWCLHFSPGEKGAGADANTLHGGHHSSGTFFGAQ